MQTQTPTKVSIPSTRTTEMSVISQPGSYQAQMYHATLTVHLVPINNITTSVLRHPQFSPMKSIQLSTRPVKPNRTFFQRRHLVERTHLSSQREQQYTLLIHLHTVSVSRPIKFHSRTLNSTTGHSQQVPHIHSHRLSFLL